MLHDVISETINGTYSIAMNNNWSIFEMRRRGTPWEYGIYIQCPAQRLLEGGRAEDPLYCIYQEVNGKHLASRTWDAGTDVPARGGHARSCETNSCSTILSAACPRLRPTASLRPQPPPPPTSNTTCTCPQVYK